MGFLTNTAGITLTAKLTPEGRRSLIVNSSDSIATFSLGDSDAYYGVYDGLVGGQVPVISGNNNGADRSNGGYRYNLRSTLNYNATTDKKPVDSVSQNVVIESESLGLKTIHNDGVSLQFDVVNLSGTSNDTLTNLFYTFRLPLTSSQFNTYTGKTTTSGGYANTALSGLAQDQIFVVSLAEKDYAEIIDGKSIKMTMPASGQTYDIYSSYENGGLSRGTYDGAIFEIGTRLNIYGPNVALLFCDTIKTPNGGDPAKSWATGYGTTKPFAMEGKELWNYQTNDNISLTADTPVGIAYLDKGFLVITDPTIIESYTNAPTWSGLTQTKVTFNHYRNKVSQSVTCIARGGEFASSSNPTWTATDVPRITEVALWSSTGTLMAVGKLNKTYEKPPSDLVAFNVKIDY
jgi:hypothetical protein